MVYTSLIPALRQRQADFCELEASLVYIESSSNSKCFFLSSTKKSQIHVHLLLFISCLLGFMHSGHFWGVEAAMWWRKLTSNLTHLP